MSGRVLLAGGTGTLGTEVVRLLTARGMRLRVLSRHPGRALPPQDDLVEIVNGDVRRPDDLSRALADVAVVVSAVHGFAGTGGVTPSSVDRDGNRNLIRAAEAARVEHFVLMSVVGARPDHPMELMRMKHAAEQALRASSLSWTIIRPTAFMETWLGLLAEPLLETGKTRIFGSGRNPINFVSAREVAGYVELAIIDPAQRGRVIEVGGPENLTFTQLVSAFAAFHGLQVRAMHIPRAMMRLMAVLSRPVKPGLARQIRAAVVMDTRDMTFDAAANSLAHPAIKPVTLADVIAPDRPGPGSASPAPAQRPARVR